MSRSNFHLPWAQYVETLKPHERPMLPGSPATPDHSLPYRLAYGAVGMLVTATGGIGAAMVTANTQQLAGALGVSLTEAAWLPVVFVMTNACMNLLLIKFRMQYGLRLFAQIFLTAYVLIGVGALFFEDYQSTLIVRAFAGMASAALTTLGFLYTIQAFPAAHRLKGLVLAIGASSLAIPAVRIFSNHLVELSEWRGFHVFELGLSLISLAAVLALRLPPSEKMRVFDRLDFITFALFAPGMALLCAVLGLGRIVWWTEAAWVGWALIGSIVLLTAALIVEFNRETPLINLRWITGPDILRLALIIVGIRIVLSEQTYGAVGLMTQMGLGPDQMHGLFWLILIATIAGSLVSAFTMNPAKLYKPIAIALGLIAVGAFMDAHSTVLTRPAQLYFSQILLAFAAAFFIGPAMMTGIVQVLQKGAQNMVSFIVVFGIGQNVGGLLGSAIVGTIQTVREKFHSSQLSESVNLGDPDVVLRLQQLSGAYARVIGDPAQRTAQGQHMLQQQISQQAHVLAYNDVFLLIAVFAAIGCVWVTLNDLRPRFETRRAARKQASADVAAAASAID
ncbi:MFS transporter [Brevundimonas kwangchunensis]|uniref:MFS transporter n=1 Tax=Brevundimonas kwangchunensis TaxID=322163 RepID=A0ABP3RZ06_9CAUL